MMTAAEVTALQSGPYAVHVTVDNERWDQIAASYYGDPMRFEVLIAANPDLPIAALLPGGLQVLVPVVDNGSTPDVLADTSLPPWKQQAAS